MRFKADSYLIIKHPRDRSLEFAAAATAILGAALLAVNLDDVSKWGFVCFFVSNSLWMAWGIKIKAYYLVVTQVCFFITSVVGIWRWFF